MYRRNSNNSSSGGRRFGGGNDRGSSGERRSFGGGGYGRSSGGRRRGFGGGRGRGRSTVDISQFIRKAQEQAAMPVETYETKHTFKDFNFLPTLQMNIEAKGYSNPTPIQDQVIKSILEGKDVVGLANTGTGKTAAFLLPLIQKIAKQGHGRVLVIVPVRELADQIRNEFITFAKGMNVHSTIVIGGAGIHKQIELLRRKPQFVIGTPGRLKDLFERRALDLIQFDHVVLDEVDRMFDMGFAEDVSFLLSKVQEKRQSLFFSATMPAEIQRLADTHLKDPVKISVKTREITANVQQEIVTATNHNKFEKLLELLQSNELEKVLIFCETKRGTETLMRHLDDNGVDSVTIHGDKTQAKRQQALRLFKENKVKIMIATDVAARGLDIPNVTHVINYDKPQSYEDYIHRIGRTGRGNQQGVAMTFITARF